MKNNSHWLALAIGNSRLHWAHFYQEILVRSWDSEHLLEVGKELPTEVLPLDLSENCSRQLPLYIASVVPAQTTIWQNYPYLIQIELKHIPLQGIYPTMGIDRALALLGAGEIWSFPCLVIDAGTALTFTGANGLGEVIGGAILPGLKLQLQSLSQQTAALPEVKLNKSLPPRWANRTSEAIESGVIYTLLSGIKDFIEEWWRQFPDSRVVLTGGDGELLLNYLQVQFPNTAAKISVDSNLIFWGIRTVAGKMPS